jgi:formate-dependent nitrite reductase cytochrome c552 subunit
MNVKEKLEMIKKYYDEISDEEFKERLIKAGFDIIEGQEGQIIFEEYDK